ncbi:MAG: glycosyltransferase family 4 protein, partial [Acidimicrobiales bacterium]
MASSDVVVAVLPWGSVIEDFLEPIDADLDHFVQEMTGGWLFGYVDGLQRNGAVAVLVCVSTAVSQPTTRVHRGTGALMWVLPAGRVQRSLRRWARDRSTGWRRARSDLAEQVLPWCSTPVRGLLRALQDQGVTAVLCQEYSEARFDVCLAVGRVLGIRVFATFQGGDWSPTWLERRTRRWIVRRAAGVLVGSSAEADRLQRELGVPGERVHLVPNPIDLDEWSVGERAAARARVGISPDAQVVSWHGRLDRSRKGIDVLLDAWSRVVAADGPERVLLMTGTGPDAPFVREALASGLRGVRWRDEYVFDRTIIRTQLAAADIATLTSRHEGFAVSLLEMMASGRAAVATDVPGVADVAPRGELDGCVIVPVGDAE